VAAFDNTNELVGKRHDRTCGAASASRLCRRSLAARYLSEQAGILRPCMGSHRSVGASVSLPRPSQSRQELYVRISPARRSRTGTTPCSHRGGVQHRCGRGWHRNTGKLV